MEIVWVVVVGYPPGVGGDCGRVGVVILGRGGNRFCGRFLGRVRVFGWRGVWITGKIILPLYGH